MIKGMKYISIIIASLLLLLLPFHTSAEPETLGHDRVDSTRIDVFDVPEHLYIPLNTSYHFYFNGTITIEASTQFRTIEVVLASILIGGNFEPTITPNEFTFRGSGTHVGEFNVEVRVFPVNETYLDRFDDGLGIGIKGGYKETPPSFQYYTPFNEVMNYIPVTMILPENETVEPEEKTEGMFEKIPLPLIILIPILLIAVLVIVGFWYFKKRNK